MFRNAITVRERSSRPVDRPVFRALEDSPEFVQLLDEGIVSLERNRRSGYAVRANAFVGQALVGETLLRVEEKIPGSLAALIALAEQPDARIADPASFAEEEHHVIYAMIDRFMGHLDQYLTYGREKVYRERRATGGMPRGKILMGETMRLWATGRQTQVVYKHHELSPRTFLNQLVGMALHVADSILAVSESSRLERVRTAAILFEDTDWHELHAYSRQDLDHRFKELRPHDGNTAAMAALARLLSLHFGVATVATNETVPFSWFVSLENLFQECVLKTFGAAAKERGLKATDWRAATRYMFPAEKDYRTHPDVVIWQGTSPVAVLDAKYKDVTEEDGTSTSPSAADLYQLAAHAKAWGVDRAALVYPANETRFVHVGTDAGGVTVGYLFFDLRAPRQAARDGLNAMMQPVTAQNSDA